MFPTVRHHKQKGQAMIQTLGLMIATVMIGALAIDTGFYYANTQSMRCAADAAALSSAAELFKNGATGLQSRLDAARASGQAIANQNANMAVNVSDMEFGFVDPLTGHYDAQSFTTPTTNSVFSITGGYNAIRVRVQAADGQANTPIPALFSTILGNQNYDAAVDAVAIYGGGVSGASGLRPVYLCQTAWDYAKQTYGDPTLPQITFYGNTLQVGNTSLSQAQTCGAMGPGNWGLADFDRNSGAPGNSTVSDWWDNGYSGTVNVGEDYEVQPGNPIQTYTSTFNTLKNEGTVIQVPLYSSTTGNGSNARFHVSQIASFVITDYKTTGPQAQRYIRGYFRRSLCTSDCTMGSTLLSGDVTRIRLVH